MESKPEAVVDPSKTPTTMARAAEAGGNPALRMMGTTLLHVRVDHH
jgi:hypothetical protein